MQILEEKYPNNGLNRDDESRVVPVNESRFILNLRGGSSDSDNTGSIENIKGTTEVTFDLPDGDNVCIGSYGDHTTHSNFFFVYNSLGNHSIYRYFPESREIRLIARDSLFNFTEFDLINDINVVDNLLYWRDFENPPRKINIDKADIDDLNRKQVFHWYLGDKYLENESVLRLSMTSRPTRYDTQNLAFTAQLNLNPALTEKTEIARDLASQINNISTVNSISVGWEAEACGEFVEIRITDDLYYTIVGLKNNVGTAQVVPQSHYIDYVDRTIDVIKHPPHCELDYSVESDNEFNRNYIKEKVFQFAARYIYDDNEKSTINPHSTHVFNKFVCSQFEGNNINNYIKVDLSVFPEINDLLEVQSIRAIELFVREGELGVWKSITVLEQFEFIDTSDQHFKFYNDGRYNEADQQDFVRPFDLVPIRTKNQEVVKNRMFYGNNLEGRDNVCIDTELNVTYEDKESAVKKPTYSVGGTVHIRSCFNSGLTNGAALYHQPIYKEPFLSGDQGQTVWGGISANGNAGGLAGNLMASRTGQILPLDGFVVYLAGTDFKAVSRQRIGNSPSKNNISQDSNGVYYDPTGNPLPFAFLNELRKEMEEPGFDNVLSSLPNVPVNFIPTPKWAEATQTRVANEFTIPNVPDGWYTLRVASHKTTQEELDDPDRSYQLTSTNTFRIMNMEYQSTLENPNPPTPMFQSMKEGDHELLIHVQGGNIPLIKIEIMDLSDADGEARIATGYVVDADKPTAPSTYEEYLSDTRVARAAVIFDQTGAFAFNHGDFKNDEGSVTDHNGYYHFASGFGGNMSIDKIEDNELLLDYNTGSSKIEENGNSIGNIGGNEFREISIRIPAGASTQKRVKVKGNIQDNQANGVPKATAVALRAVPIITDNDGDYEFWHYGVLQLSINPFRQLEPLMFPTQTGSSCSTFYDDNQIYDFGFNYTTWYNSNPRPQLPDATNNMPPLEISVPSFIGDTAGLIVTNTMKRGGDWKFGIVYYDRGLRSTAVNTEEGLRLHIPFYTEKASDGNQKIGVPILDWKVNHRPPNWATHWQWVRTRNTTVDSYFQWTLVDVRYEDASVPPNPSNFSSGTRVVLDFSNIQKYKELNPSFDFQMDINTESTRVRFIKDNGGNLYSEYVDLKVLEVNGGEVVVEKDFSTGQLNPGTVVEFYNEVLDIDEDIYYEFGECFEVGTDANGNKFHKGLTQDQDPISPSLTPATGTFRTGDAYYRLRAVPDVTVNTPIYVDDDAVSDFYFSEVESIGRPNAENADAAEIWKTNQIRHSGLYVPDSNVNNLSKFESSNFKPLSIEFGAIHKLQLSSNVLISIHEFRHVSNYIGETITRKQGGGDELLATTDVFGSDRASKDNTGTVNQESVFEYRGNIWSWDKNKGIINRWGADGLTPISEYKMIDYFTDKSKAVLNNEDKGVDPFRAIGVYDSKHDEYIISFSQINERPTEDDPVKDDPTFRVNLGVNNSQTIDDGTNDTLYSVKGEKNEGSVILFDRGATPDLKGVQVDNRVDSKGFLSVKIKDENGVIEEVARLESGQGIGNLNLQTKNFDVKTRTADSSAQRTGTGKILVTGETVAFSERMKRWSTFYSFRPEMFGIIDLEMIAFTNGRLWIHNDSEVRNNFYGVQYPSQVEVISNIHPGQVKVFQAIAAESYNPWHVPTMETPNGMKTQILPARFVRREDSFFAPVMRDINTPNIANFNEAILNGQQLRDRTAMILLQNDDNTEVTLFSVGIQLTISPRHQK